MPRVIIKRAAISDLATYIAQDNPERAVSFIEQIKAACGIWAENPLAGRDRSDVAEGVRSFPHGNYIVFYRPLHDGLEVLHVLHGKRDIRHLW